MRARSLTDPVPASDRCRPLCCVPTDPDSNTTRSIVVLSVCLTCVSVLLVVPALMCALSQFCPVSPPPVRFSLNVPLPFVTYPFVSLRGGEELGIVGDEICA